VLCVLTNFKQKLTLICILYHDCDFYYASPLESTVPRPLFKTSFWRTSSTDHYTGLSTLPWSPRSPECGFQTILKLNYGSWSKNSALKSVLMTSENIIHVCYKYL